LLIGRDKEGLKRVSDEIKKTFNVKISFILADLSKEKDIEFVSKKLSELNVTLLVNNAGFGIGKDFVESDPELLSAMVKVHCESTVRFSRAVLPNMISSKNGNIINISSLAVFFKNRKNNTIYESTKTFIVSFSQALAREVEGSGVKIQVLCPSYTKTNFIKTDSLKGRDYSMVPEWMWMMPEEVVDESLRKLKNKKTLLIPGRVNKRIAFLLRCKLLSWMPNILVRRKKK
jgi:short-subunit dehydrogenase